MSEIHPVGARQRFSDFLRGVARAWEHLPWIDAVFLAMGLALAVTLRYTLLDFKSLDFYASLKPWYNTIRAEGFSAFSTGFSTYNPPYLYLLYLIARLFPDLPVVVAVKLPALVADFLCGFVVYLTVRLRYGRGTARPIVAAFIVVFAPTVVLNSAFWGQADSIFTVGLVACVYLLMIRRASWAMLFFGVAMAFKLQAIFLAPVLLALTLNGTVPWKSLLLVPLTLLAALVPAWIAGRPIADLLNIYLYQASQFEIITMNAPSAYAWVPGTKQVFNQLYAPGILMGLAAAFVWFVLIYRSPRPAQPPTILEIALCSLLMVPFFLPKMHERYFFPADVLSIAFAFFFPRMFYVPILVVGVSFLSYQPFLFETEPVPLPILAVVLLITIAALFYHSLTQLYAGDLEEHDPGPPVEGTHAA